MLRLEKGPPFCRPPATVAKGSCRCGPDRCRGSRGMAGSLPARTLSAVVGLSGHTTGIFKDTFFRKVLRPIPVRGAST